jgi:ribonuclease P protein component
LEIENWETRISQFSIFRFQYCMLGRLQKSADFERVRIEGMRLRGKLCVVNAAQQPFLPATTPAPAPVSLPPTNAAPANTFNPTLSYPALTRVGYIATRKTGKATQRNRARRLLREAMRLLADDIVKGWDIVLIAQSKLTDKQARVKLPAVQEELRWLLNQAKLMK